MNELSKSEEQKFDNREEFLWRNNLKGLGILLFLLFASNGGYCQGKIYAVFVGVSIYESGNNLTYSHQDAIEMYELLRFHTTTNRMQLLTNHQATRGNIIYHANRLFKQANADDIALFFFSGHGSENNFCAHDKWLAYSDLHEIFKNCNATRKLIFADACYAGGLRSDNSPATTYNSQTLGKNVLLFLASRSNQTSFETSNLKNGYFTYFLLAGLNGGADADKNKIITAYELFKFVSVKVKEQSRGKQAPVMWGKFDKNMSILNWNKKH
ncbi:MAG: caspase family protein [Prevotellaceae bacterium]|jgi:hypothetical protein|nr:caspase family protein [Prevotellaceae bacterium]